jgi:hypothetical protein
MQQNILFHSALFLPNKSGFSLIFSCHKIKLFRTFGGIYCGNYKDFPEAIASRISSKIVLEIPQNILN